MIPVGTIIYYSNGVNYGQFELRSTAIGAIAGV